MTTPARYRKITTEVEAIQWTGDNATAVIAFAGTNFVPLDEPCDDDADATASVFESRHWTWALIHTGDWIIRDAAGQLSRCREWEFPETYEAAP